MSAIVIFHPLTKISFNKAVKSSVSSPSLPDPSPPRSRDPYSAPCSTAVPRITREKWGRPSALAMRGGIDVPTDWYMCESSSSGCEFGAIALELTNARRRRQGSSRDHLVPVCDDVHEVEAAVLPARHEADDLVLDSWEDELVAARCHGCMRVVVVVLTDALIRFLTDF